MRAIALGYHDVVDKRRSPFLSATRRHYALELAEFRSHLQAISQSRVHISIVAGSQTASWLTTPVFLTFDDGAECAMTQADELERLGWRGHFFVTTDWIGRAGFVTHSQIRELKHRGHVIGSHSCSHPERMSHLSQRQLDYEWRTSQQVLTETLGDRVLTASVPNGYHSRQVARMAARAGFQVLFTSEPTSDVAVADGFLVLGRYFIHQGAPSERSANIAAGRLWPRWTQTILWQIKKPAKVLGGDLYLKVRRELLSRFSVAKAAD